MISKQLLNKCLYVLNKHCRYKEVSYEVHNYNRYAMLSIYIWDKLSDIGSNIIEHYARSVYDSKGLNIVEEEIINFMKQNKEIIGEKI